VEISSHAAASAEFGLFFGRPVGQRAGEQDEIKPKIAGTSGHVFGPIASREYQRGPDLIRTNVRPLRVSDRRQSGRGLHWSAFARQSRGGVSWWLWDCSASPRHQGCRQPDECCQAVRDRPGRCSPELASLLCGDDAPRFVTLGSARRRTTSAKRPSARIAVLLCLEEVGAALTLPPREALPPPDKRTLRQNAPTRTVPQYRGRNDHVQTPDRVWSDATVAVIRAVVVGTATVVLVVRVFWSRISAQPTGNRLHRVGGEPC